MKKLSFADAPAVLFEFESTFFEQLKSIHVNGWNIWSICKVPLFYYLIRLSESCDEQAQEKVPSKRKSILNSLLKYIKYYNLKRDALFLTYSADKLSLDRNGLFFNAIIHPILELGRFEKPIVVEYPTANGFLEPARFDWHIDGRIIDAFARIKKKISKRQIQSFEQSQILCDIFNSFLKIKGYDNYVDVQRVDNIIAIFFLQKNSYHNVFRHRKPSIVIGSELMAQGLLAAAIELNIPVIEIQHGAIDSYYPPYVWNEGFSDLEKVLKPTKVLVFGDFAKNIIIKSGFFKADEIVPVGYSRIDEVRSQYEEDVDISLKQKILVVVQPMMHAFNLSLIQQLLNLQKKDYKLLFKTHPLQPEHEKREYEQLLIGSNIQLIDNKENIHKLIMDSDIVIGHVTTCLEEALTLGKPSLTITTNDLPLGIHSMTGNDALIDAIVPCSLSEIKEILFRYYEDEVYRNSWNSIVSEKKYLIYSSDYHKRLNTFLKSIKMKE